MAHRPGHLVLVDFAVKPATIVTSASYSTSS
jgi:hypothetical protein